jgi:hypothetical protein|tara:strand:+ start:37 stop:426 length:390 start_codon:yes stop_codon:yes gene_type:complete
MKERIGVSLVLLLALFALFPSLFSKGGLLVEHIKYYNNVFFTLMYLVVSFTGIAIPFILPRMKRVTCVISQMLGAWFFAAFLYELFNFAIPDVVLNNNEDRTLYTKFLIAFIIGLSTIMIRETWQKSEK